MKKLLIGIGIILLLFIILIITNWNILSDLRSLKDVTLENISIEGGNYSLRDGKIYENGNQIFWFFPGNKEKIEKVLNVAGFYMWNKEDPLFDSPDLNVSEFSKSVSLLDTQQKILLSSLKQTNPLYPTEFLKEFVKTAALNREFMKKPSAEKAAELLKSQKKTAELYKKESSSLKSAIRKSELTPITFNLQLSNKTVLKDLDKIIKNGDSLEEEITKREKCLSGGRCERPGLHFTEPGNLPKMNLLPNPPALSADFVYYERSKNSHGPYATNTACFGWGDNFTQPLNYFYIRKVMPEENTTGKDRNLSYLNIQLATDIFFRKLLPDSQTAGEKELYELGYKYIYSGTTTPYNCPDRNSFMEIAQIDFLLHEEKPILQEVELPNASYKNFEREFFEQKYPSFEQLSYLSKIYGYLYKEILENPNADWAQKLKPQKDELLERYLGTQRKLGNAPLALNSHIFFIEGLNQRQELEKRYDESYIKDFIYPFRNFYGIMYLPFTSSVWRTEENLDYMDKVQVKGAVDPETGGYISYTQAKKLYSEEEIRSWFTGKAVSHTIVEE